jgi:hypothetical protein
MRKIIYFNKRIIIVKIKSNNKMKIYLIKKKMKIMRKIIYFNKRIIIVKIKSNNKMKILN